MGWPSLMNTSHYIKAILLKYLKFWNSAFLPFLWSTIRIHGLARLPFEAVEAHAKYICELTLMDDVDLRYGTDLFCPNLNHLTIDSFLDIDNYFRAPAYAFNDLIRRHRHTLQSIRFSRQQTRRCGRPWRTVLSWSTCLCQS